MSTDSRGTDANGYSQLTVSNCSLLKPVSGLTEHSDAPEIEGIRGLHPVEVTYNKSHWAFTAKIRVSPKKVSMVVQWRKVTAVVWDGPISCKPTVQQKP